jgi:hypothetical protein
MSIKFPLLLTLPLLLPSVNIKGQDFLDLRVPFFEVKNVAMEEALVELKLRWMIQVCLEKVPKESEDEKEVTVSIKLENATIREILDALVKADPRYYWEVYDSHLNKSAKLINVLPVGAKGASDSPMTIKVKRAVIKDVTPNNAINQIDHWIPELVKKLHPEGLPGHAFYGIGARVRIFKIHFEFEDLTVREILNEIALRSGGISWVFESVKKPSQVYRWRTF